jgi:hypothetical protein
VRRVFWLALGLGAGATMAVLAARRVRRATEAVAPANLAKEAQQALSDLGQLIRESFEAGRRAMADKEAEVREALDGSEPAKREATRP